MLKLAICVSSALVSCISFSEDAFVHDLSREASKLAAFAPTDQLMKQALFSADWNDSITEQCKTELKFSDIEFVVVVAAIDETGNTKEIWLDPIDSLSECFATYLETNKYHVPYTQPYYISNMWSRDHL